MRLILLYFFLCSIPLSLAAQFNDSTFYHLTLNAAGALNKTSTGNQYLLNNGFGIAVKKKDMVLNSTSSWLYGKQNAALSNNDFSTALNFNLYKTLPHFYYWGLLNYVSSYSLKINHQFQAGLGVAYHLIDRENTNLNISNGILFDTSNLFSEGSYRTYRNSLRLQYRIKVKDLIIFEGSNFLQNSLSNKDDYIINCTNKLGIKLKKWISLNTILNYNKMSITRSENLNLSYGITIDQYF